MNFTADFSILLCVASSVSKSSSILSWWQTAGSTLGHEHYVEGLCVEYLRHDDDNYFYVNVLALNLHIIVSFF